MDRRDFLRGGVAAVALGLAGCGGNGDNGAATTDDGDGEPTTTSTTAEPAETTTAMGGESTTAMDGESTTTTLADTTTTTTTTTTTASPAQVVEVAVDGSFRFGPESFTVSAGETVQWVWRQSGHNVVAESTPDGSDWSGTPGAPDRTFSSGHTYAYTFETPGDYEYFCNPHQSLGMVGSFTVE